MEWNCGGKKKKKKKERQPGVGEDGCVWSRHSSRHSTRLGRYLSCQHTALVIKYQHISATMNFKELCCGVVNRPRPRKPDAYKSTISCTLTGIYTQFEEILFALYFVEA